VRTIDVIECRYSPPLVDVHRGIAGKEFIFATITGIICKINIMINLISVRDKRESSFATLLAKMLKSKILIL
jgi:hypothetical protein